MAATGIDQNSPVNPQPLPQENQGTSGMSPFVQAEASDFSPPLSTEPAPTVPPFISHAPETPAPGEAQQTPPTPAPVLTTPPQPETGVGNASIMPPPKSGISKKILFMFIGILLLIIVVIVFVKVLLPRLTGGLASTKEANLTWWGLWEDKTTIEPLIAQYQQEHPNVKITYVTQSREDYRERLTNALAKGEGPDIFRYHNTWVPMFRSELATLPSSVMSSQEFTQTFYPVAVSDLTSGSGIVGIPLEYDGLALFINEEIFATYGKTAPATWNELRDVALDLTIKDENGFIKQSGVALGLTKNVDHWQEILALMMIQNGTDMKKPTGELAEGGLSFFTSFNTNYKVWDDTLPSSTIAFASGKVAMYIGPSWRAFEVLDQNPNLQFKVVPIPQLPKEDPSEPDVTYATYWVEGVWEKSENKEAAWQFLKFMSSKDTLTTFYESARKIRKFGEPYPRVDMRDLILTDPIVGGFIAYAPNAKSWYLASRTFDGPTGINTLMSKYFEDAVNSLTEDTGSGDPESLMQTVSAGVRQVLVQYGIIAAPAPTPE